MRRIKMIGNIGSDAKVFEHANTACISFSIATNERRKDKDGVWHDATCWHTCTYWGKRQYLESIVPHMKKGTKVYAEGSFWVDIYNDAPKIEVAVTFLDIVAAPKTN